MILRHSAMQWNWKLSSESSLRFADVFFRTFFCFVFGDIDARLGEHPPTYLAVSCCDTIFATPSMQPWEFGDASALGWEHTMRISNILKIALLLYSRRFCYCIGGSGMWEI